MADQSPSPHQQLENEFIGNRWYSSKAHDPNGVPPEVISRLSRKMDPETRARIDRVMEAVNNECGAVIELELELAQSSVYEIEDEHGKGVRGMDDRELNLVRVITTWEGATFDARSEHLYLDAEKALIELVIELASEVKFLRDFASMAALRRKEGERAI